MTKTTHPTDRQKRYFGLIFLILISPVFFLPISSGGPKIDHLDKLIHFAFHFGVTAWFLFAREKLITAALISGTYGMLIEILQPLTAHRSFELLDIVANLSGMIAAILIGKKIRRQSSL